MRKMFVWVLVVAALLAAPTTQATTVELAPSLVHRVYISNSALSVFLTSSHPPTCVWGIVANQEDAAYDRWIAMMMLAYSNSEQVTVQYDDTTCNILSVAIGTVPGQ